MRKPSRATLCNSWGSLAHHKTRKVGGSLMLAVSAALLDGANVRIGARGRSTGCRGSARAFRLGRWVTGPGFALPRDAGQRPAFQAVCAMRLSSSTRSAVLRSAMGRSGDNSRFPRQLR